MRAEGVEGRLTAVLRAMNATGKYPLSLVCTERGLLIASAGEFFRSEITAALASLFDEIAVRAARDLGLADIEELSVSDAGIGRFVVRPLTRAPGPRLFLVVQVPPQRSWRRNSSVAARRLRLILQPLLAAITPTDETRGP